MKGNFLMKKSNKKQIKGKKQTQMQKKKPLKANGKKTKPQKQKTKGKNNRIISVPTNKAPKLIENKLLRKTNFMSSTSSTHSTMYNMRHIGGNKFEVSPRPKAYSAILKLVLNITQTADMTFAWSKVLWDITQSNILDKDVKITSVRAFEKKDEDQARKDINSRKKISLFGSDKAEKVKERAKAVSHDQMLLDALDSADGVMNFGAELIVTAPTEIKLEKAVNDVSNYLKMNDETRGLQWKLDVNAPRNPATKGDNTVDNVEQVLIDQPAAGVYKIEVSNKGTLVNNDGANAEKQTYSIIVTGYTEIPSPEVIPAEASPTLLADGNNKVNVKFIENINSIKIFDMSGRLIRSIVPSSVQTYDVDFSGFPAGIYVLTASSANHKLSKKIRKQ